jgi:hypothetical protein
MNNWKIDATSETKYFGNMQAQCSIHVLFSTLSWRKLMKKVSYECLSTEMTTKIIQQLCNVPLNSSSCWKPSAIQAKELKSTKPKLAVLIRM